MVAANSSNGARNTPEHLAAYPDASGAAFHDSVGHGGSGWINHGDEACKAEPTGGEVHLVAVEVVAAWELALGKVQVAETCGERESL